MAWEAQFGDFANGAQIIIDQFIVCRRRQVGPADRTGVAVAARSRRPGAGAFQRPHRALSAAVRARQYAGVPAFDRRAVFPSAAPAGAAQVAQAADLLHAEEHVAPSRGTIAFAELERPRFQNVIPDETALDAKRVLLCTGKIGQELRMERRKLKMQRAGDRLAGADVSFPEDELVSCSAVYKNATEFIWVQEEPANMGALSFVTPRLKRVLGSKLRSIKRAANATPATGSAKAHELEQKTLHTGTGQRGVGFGAYSKVEQRGG